MDLYDDTDETEDLPECPACGSGTVVEVEDDDTAWCHTCGGSFRVESSEEVESHLQFSFYGDLTDMTLSEAKDYVEEMLDHIHRATGYLLLLDKIE
jgi:transcription elongation factor Elf1